MLARVTAFAIDGVESRRVTVEADIRRGLPCFSIVGLADKAVREARERVRSAIVNTGFEFPDCRITVNLAPAYLRKVGPSFDLALAVVILAASGQVSREAVEDTAFAGELGLYGELRPIVGALAWAEGARAHAIRRLVLTHARAAEAALVPEVEILAARSLQEAVEILRGADPPPIPVPAQPRPDAPTEPDLSEVRGQPGVFAPLEVAAAGGHNLFMTGPPGTGKTMLARRLPTVLPPLSRAEAIEVTRIHSVAGLHDGSGLIEQRPFRAPHHLISAAGLVGGGNVPRPGEITLAHHGVLFLDELSEFNRAALESLRQPLEDGRVVVVRSQRVLAFPTRAMLIAASNPCPCGMSPDGCRCSAADLERHRRRLSGPLMDRMDIMLRVERPSAAALSGSAGPSSADVRSRVIAARERQQRRLAGTGAQCNAQMTPRMLADLARITPSARRTLYERHDEARLSARGHHRVLRVARTIADLEGSDVVGPEHVSSALTFRTDADATEAVAA